MSLIDHLKDVADGISYGLIFTTLVGWLPEMAALISIAWTSYQWYHKIQERKKNGPH